MKLKSKDVHEKFKTPISSIVMYVIATIIVIIAVVTLINNIKLYNDAIAYYVSQGSPIAQVRSQLMLSQLLPGILQPIATYGGIAFILISAGMINHKVSKCLKMLSKVEISEDVIEETTLEENIDDIDSTEHIETVEKSIETSNE